MFPLISTDFLMNSLLAIPLCKFGDILIFLEAGFSSNDNPPSKKVLGSYLTPQNVAGVVELIGEALNIAMPQEEISKSKN